MICDFETNDFDIIAVDYSDFFNTTAYFNLN